MSSPSRLIRCMSPRPAEAVGDRYQHAARIRQRVGSVPHAGQLATDSRWTSRTIPAWFLRLAAPIFCKTIAYLFNMSLATPTVPRQCKEAQIQLLLKVPAPKQHVDYRPISITPIVFRLMERTVVRTFLYLTPFDPPPTLALSDQFAFRPTCSTSAAIISLLHTDINLLQFNPFVVVISLNSLKAFDTVRHSTLLSKLAELDLPTPVIQLAGGLFSGHSHAQYRVH